MYCVKCGEHIADNSKFCNCCGAKLENSITSAQIKGVNSNTSYNTVSGKRSILFWVMLALIAFIMSGGWLDVFFVDAGHYYEDTFSLWGFIKGLEKMDDWGIDIFEALDGLIVLLSNVILKIVSILGMGGGLYFIYKWLSGGDKISLIGIAEISNTFGYIMSATIIIVLFVFNGGSEQWDIIGLSKLGISLLVAPIINTVIIKKYGESLYFEEIESADNKGDKICAKCGTRYRFGIECPNCGFKE